MIEFSETSTPTNSTDNPVKVKQKNGKHPCMLCDRLFSHKNSLVYHMRGHTGNRPHQCTQCGKSFYSSSALKIHIRMHTGTDLEMVVDI